MNSSIPFSFYSIRHSRERKSILKVVGTKPAELIRLWIRGRIEILRISFHFLDALAELLRQDLSEKDVKKKKRKKKGSEKSGDSSFEKRERSGKLRRYIWRSRIRDTNISSRSLFTIPSVEIY